MRKNADYAVARRNGAIAVSLDQAENLLEGRSPTDTPELDAGRRAAGTGNPTHQRRAADKPHSGWRQRAARARRRVRGLWTRVWHSLFPARRARDDSSAP
jgi:hypothetical protein